MALHNVTLRGWKRGGEREKSSVDHKGEEEKGVAAKSDIEGAFSSIIFMSLLPGGGGEGEEGGGSN